MLIIFATNITGATDVADYRVEIHIGPAPPIWTGYIQGHERADGLHALLQMIASAVAENPPSPAEDLP